MTSPRDAATHARIVRLRQAALVVAFPLLVACAIGALFRPVQLLRSYLFSYTLCAGIALGCLGLLMLSHLTGGQWGLVPRRIFEAAARTLPFLLVAFAPIALGARSLYPWAASPGRSESLSSHNQQLYLNLPFFLLRTAVYFAIWITLTTLLCRWSLRMQTDRDPERLARRLRMLSGPGLFGFGLTACFAGFDWIMTLRPEWYSTIFPLIVLTGQGLSALAFVIVTLLGLARLEPLSQVVSVKLRHDLGKLLQAFVLLWAYMAFSQLLIIWAGNLPREISWYMTRMKTSWKWVGILLIVGQFALPFFLLLFRAVKRRPLPLRLLAAYLLLMMAINHFWLVEPEFHRQGLRVHWMDGVAPLGFGGLYVAWFFFLLGRRPLVPLLPLRRAPDEEARAPLPTGRHSS